MSGVNLDQVTVTETVVDNTTHLFDTYDFFIHPHWRKFEPVSDLWHYAVGLFISVVGISGVTGNILVIWMFSTTKNLKTPSNMLIINLALSDLTFSAVNGFPLMAVSSFMKKWVFGMIACEMYGMIGGIFGLMSINTLAMISIDRFICITRPLQAARLMTRKKAFLMIVVVWIWSVLWSIPPLFGLGRYIPEGFQTSCTFDYLSTDIGNRVFIIGMYVFGFILPLLIIIACYIKILKAIKAHSREMERMKDKLKAEDAEKNKKSRAEMRIAKIALMIITLFILSWSPYATIALIAQFGHPEVVTPFMSELPVLLAKASAMHNPIVYALSHPKFRAALMEKAPCFLACCMPREKSTKRVTRGVTDRTASQNSETSCATNYSDCHGAMQMQPTVSQGDLVKELVGAIVSMASNQNGSNSRVCIPNEMAGMLAKAIPQLSAITGQDNPAFVAESAESNTEKVITKQEKEQEPAPSINEPVST